MPSYDPLSDLKQFANYPSFHAGQDEPTAPNYQVPDAHPNTTVILEEGVGHGSPWGQDTDDNTQGNRYDVYGQSDPTMLPGAASHALPVLDAPPPSALPTDIVLAIAQQTIAAEKLSLHIAALLESLTQQRKDARDRDSDILTPVLIGVQAVPYILKTFNRPYTRIWSPTARVISVQAPSADIATFVLYPGWNPLNLAEGTLIYVPTPATAGFRTLICASYVPTDSPNTGLAIAGYVTLVSPPTQTSAGADTVLTFTAPVAHWLIQNNTAASVQFELDNVASAGSPVIAAGATWTSDVPVSQLHLFTAGAQNINGVTAANIVVKGWG